MYSLIFPTYNAGPAIATTISEASRFLKRTDDWEILFVCDGCIDDSVHRLRELATQLPSRVRVLSYTPNRGKGYAVRYGLAAARGQWRIFTDIDLAYGFDEIEKVARVLTDGAEVAIASRTHADSRFVTTAAMQGYVYRRYLQSLAFSRAARAVLSIRQKDTQAGLKGMTARVARVVLPHLTCDGFAFDCEFLAVCARFGVPVTEVAVWVRYENTKSTTSLATVGQMLRALWKIRRNCRSLATAPIENDQPLPIQTDLRAA